MTIEPDSRVAEVHEPRRADSRSAPAGAESGPNALPERAIAPAAGDPDSISRAIDVVARMGSRARDVGVPVSIRKQRDERHTTHFWVEVGSSPNVRRYFVKRYRPPLVRNIFTFLLRSRVEREFGNSRKAHSLGIPSLPAVAYAMRRRMGVVVDQVIVFDDAGKCRSASQLIDAARERGEFESTRRSISMLLADDLRAMHERGYSHLSMSPRNYLRVLAQERFVFIDHNASLVFPRAIHARDEAVPDLLNLFESRRMFPDASAQQEFLARYAPESSDFRERVMRKLARGERSDRAARLQKFRRALSRFSG